MRCHFRSVLPLVAFSTMSPRERPSEGPGRSIPGRDLNPRENDEVNFRNMIFVKLYRRSSALPLYIKWIGNPCGRCVSAHGTRRFTPWWSIPAQNFLPCQTKRKIPSGDGFRSGCRTGHLIQMILPAMSVELYRYRGAAKDGGTLESP